MPIHTQELTMDEPKPKQTGLAIAAGSIALVLCCLCIAALIMLAWGAMLSSAPEPTRAMQVTSPPTRPTITPARRVTPTLRLRPTLTPYLRPTATLGVLKPSPNVRRDPVPPEAVETAKLLQSVTIPKRDLRDVTLRLADPGVPIPEITRQQPWNFAVGDKHGFWVYNEDEHKNYWITATLVYMTPHTYIWVEDGVQTSRNALKAAADRFENKTYPTNRAFFGSEWTPGIDNDVHLSMLISDKLGTFVGGYYSSMDEYSRLIHKYSNEMEMFYISNFEVGSPFLDCALAHEFQHMIHWYHHSNQANWINEGLSELACQINGLDVGGNMYDFADEPDTQLDSWPDETGEASANYGASYLFMSYFLDRFGKEATQALVANPSYGYAAVSDVLSKTGLTFEDVFADWIVANYINDPRAGQGLYAYKTITPPEFQADVTLRQNDYPMQKTTTVSQYGTDYIELRGHTDVQVSFAGATLVGLANINAHSGKYLWWGARANSSDTTLTREFDLTGVKTATLTFWTWYDIENDFDYAYVEASTDGKHWETLPGQSTTNDDPNGANYTDGYTRKSGVPPADKKSPARWIQEKIDLSKYAGHKILIRFEYLTDAAVTHSGFFVDDIEIPEIGYHYDVESGEDGWQANGFIRHSNVLPQRWLVQLITVGRTKTTVEKLPLASDQTGQWTIPLGADIDYAVLTISALAPVTTEPAWYWFAVTPK